MLAPGSPAPAGERLHDSALERRRRIENEPVSQEEVPVAGERRTIDEVLAEARATLRRYSPEEAAAALRRGAVLVDIRPAAQRAHEGEIPGALVIERNVLEWRFDPASSSRIDAARDHDLEVVVFCSEGYTSSLAAVSLRDLGLQRATDLEGGFSAWKAAGLPVTGPTTARPGRSEDEGVPTAVVIDPFTDLSVDGLLRVAAGAPVELSEGACERLRGARDVVEETLAAGVAAYGLNGGLGHARDERLPAEQLARYQTAIVLGHDGGIGAPLPTEAVRAAMAARLNSAARGGSAISQRTAGMLADLLNAGVHPIVPAIGSVGASDLMHLAAIAAVAIGHGEAELAGQRLGGAEALAAAGLEPLTLEPGEGLALVSANSMAIGCGGLVARRARRVLEVADLVAALSLEAVNGNLSVIEPAVGLAKPVPGQIEVIAHLRRLLAGSRLFEPEQASSLQDALSFRVIPQVHGAVRDLAGATERAVELELNAMDDNPLVWQPEGRLISNGNFHPMALALAFDGLRPGLAHVGLLSIRRMNHLAKVLFGDMADFESFVLGTGEGAGRGIAIYAGAALWAELRHLAGPATLDIESLDLEQEDHATAAPLSVEVTDRCLALLERILAVELDSAVSLIERAPEPRGLGSGTERAYRHVLAAIEDVPASAAAVNAALTTLLATGELLGVAEGA